MASIFCLSGSNISSYINTAGHQTDAQLQDNLSEGLWQTCCDWAPLQDLSIAAEHVSFRGHFSLLFTKISFLGSLGCSKTSLEAVRDALWKALANEGPRRLCKTCILPYALPLTESQSSKSRSSLSLLTRLASSNVLDKNVVNLWKNFQKRPKTTRIYQALEQWDVQFIELESFWDTFQQNDPSLSDDESD